jgi:L-cysteine S-thiosulfotransferase
MSREWVREVRSWILSTVISVLVLILVGVHTVEISDAKGPDRGPEAPIRVTDEQVHDAGGVPEGWKFRIPDGDPAAGRRIFVKMECFRCHTIQGEKFPAVDRGPKDVGPELTGIGSEGHPPEFLAESILNPNRVILIGEGYSGSDGSSVMPSYAELMSVEELLDLTAYLMSREEGGP